MQNKLEKKSPTEIIIFWAIFGSVIAFIFLTPIGKKLIGRN